jgi:hypothetical protein
VDQHAVGRIAAEVDSTLVVAGILPIPDERPAMLPNSRPATAVVTVASDSSPSWPLAC